MIVVDASAVVELLLRSENSCPIEARILDQAELPHAPHLMDVEVVHVLRRYAASGTMTGNRAHAAMEILVDLPILRYPHVELLPRIWQLRHNLSAYDAAYVALAEILGAPLMTRDRRLAAAARDMVEVELV